MKKLPLKALLSSIGCLQQNLSPLLPHRYYLLMLLVLTAIAALSTSPLEAELLDAVDRFFFTLERADVAAMHAMVDEAAALTSLYPGDGGVPKAITITRARWLDRLQGQEGKIVEVFWNPVVSISPVGLAQLLLPYYVEYEGKFAHCGVDAFSLVRREESRWVITSLHDTRDSASCDRLGFSPTRKDMRPAGVVEKLNFSR